MSATKKFLPTLFFAIILSLVVWQVEPPESFSSASPTQILLFFLPLLLFLTSAINLYAKYILKSFIFSLGITLILILKALDLFIFFSIPAAFIITLFVARSLKKPARKSFSSKPKIPPKPHLLKFPEIKPESAQPKIPNLSRLPRQEK